MSAMDAGIAVDALFSKLSQPASHSRHLPTLALAAYNARDALSTDACFHASDSALNDTDAQALGLAVMQVSPSSLNALYLGGNAIGSSGLHALLGGLHAAPALETLWLAGNALDSEAMCAFQHIPGGPVACGALTSLAIQHNRIGDDGLTAIARAVTSGALPQLRWLYAGQNGVGDAGAAALAGALAHGACPALTRLGLQSNSIGDAGLAALSEALQAGAMREGEFIYLSDNPFTSEGREALTRILAETGPQVHFGWPPPRTNSFLITPPDRLAPDEAQQYEKANTATASA